MTHRNIAAALLLTCAAATAAAQEPGLVVSTPAYRWVADSIVQGPYKAYAVSPFEIVSDYGARPHYMMPVEKQWKLHNDISAYPQLNTSNKLLQAVYNMALDEMVNAVEPDTTLRTGKEWAGVWTRDVSYSIILSMASLQPEAARISLMKKVNAEGQIIQDTGSGGAWPISTDRMIWAAAAWEIYKYTGDREWLRTVYPIIQRSVAKDRATVFSPLGLVKGETSFIDWREQSHPRWMQTADIAQTQSVGTNLVHAQAYKVLSQMASILGNKQEAKQYAQQAEELVAAINQHMWLEDKGYFGMYLYGQDFPIMNPRAETLGESLAVIWQLTTPERRRSIVEHNPVTPYGAAIFFPQISDMPNYHNNALWPFVASYWALANAKEGSEQGTIEAIGSVVRPAALFCTNKENFNLDNGDIFTELNSSNMLWSLSGNLALTQHILFGINFEPDGIRFAPFVPSSLADTRTLSNVSYRGAKLNITVEGAGSGIERIYLNGKQIANDGYIAARDLKGNCEVRIVMDGRFTPMAVNHTDNVKAPWTPAARLVHDHDSWTPQQPIMNLLEWDPVEYMAGYIVLRNGEPVGRTRNTTWPATEPGEWQVITYDEQGTPSFASAPASNLPRYNYQMPGERPVMLSAEVSYQPATPIEGYRGQGYAELDHNTAAITVPVDVPAGRYSLRLRYANGNGPVNTENKAAVRTIGLNAQKQGTLVMPTRGRGNWNDWGLSNSVVLDIPAGLNEITIYYTGDDENMNLGTNHVLIDQLELTHLNP